MLYTKYKFVATIKVTLSYIIAVYINQSIALLYIIVNLGSRQFGLEQIGLYEVLGGVKAPEELDQLTEEQLRLYSHLLSEVSA